MMFSPMTVLNKNISIKNISPSGKTRVSSKSKCSITSSLYLRAKAEKAALIKHMAALEAQQEKLHAEQERLKRQKEQLEIETQLAAATAKIAILESSVVGSGSAPSDGMNSYFDEATKSKTENSQNPTTEPTSQPHLPHLRDAHPKERKPLQTQLQDNPASMQPNQSLQRPPGGDTDVFNSLQDHRSSNDTNEN